MSENWPDIAGRIEHDRHVLAIRVYYEDTDFSGFVYHANYLKFCERARSDCLRLVGINHHELHWHETDGRSGFVVRRMVCDFLKPAVIDDIIQVQTKLVSAAGARLVLDQSVWKQEKCLFTAQVMAALIDAKGRPKRFSNQMIDAFAQLRAS